MRHFVITPFSDTVETSQHHFPDAVITPVSTPYRTAVQTSHHPSTLYAVCYISQYGPQRRKSSAEGQKNQDGMKVVLVLHTTFIPAGPRGCDFAPCTLPYTSLVPVGTDRPISTPVCTVSTLVCTLPNTFDCKISDLDFTGILLGSTGISAGKPTAIMLILCLAGGSHWIPLDPIRCKA